MMMIIVAEMIRIIMTITTTYDNNNYRYERDEDSSRYSLCHS